MSGQHPSLTIELTSEGAARTVALIGEADLAFAPAIEEAIADAATQAERVIVDLSKTTFIDSSGLRALIRGHEQCVLRGVELSVIPGPENVRRLFELTGLDEMLPFARSPLAGETAGRDDGSGRLT